MERAASSKNVVEQLPETVLLDEIAKALGDSVSQLKRLSRKSLFPRLIRVHGGNFRVLASDFRAWCHERGIPLREPPG
jgi:hypothetical protein